MRWPWSSPVSSGPWKNLRLFEGGSCEGPISIMSDEHWSRQGCLKKVAVVNANAGSDRWTRYAFAGATNRVDGARDRVFFNRPAILHIPIRHRSTSCAWAFCDCPRCIKAERRHGSSTSIILFYFSAWPYQGSSATLFLYELLESLGPWPEEASQGEMRPSRLRDRGRHQVSAKLLLEADPVGSPQT